MKKIGKKFTQVPGPRMLTQEEMQALSANLLNGTFSKAQAWQTYHLLVLTLNVQSDLNKQIVALGVDEKEARVLMRSYYEKRLTEYRAELLRVHEPEQVARPS